MVNLSVKVDTSRVDTVFAMLPTRGQRAIVRSLNRGIIAGRVVLARAIATDLGWKVGDVKAKSLKIDKANFGRAVAVCRAASKRPIPVSKLRPRGTLPSRGKGTGVSWRVGGQTYRNENAFLATMRTGHTGVFVRVGGQRRGKGAWSLNLPIKQLTGPSIADLFGKYADEAHARAIQVTIENLERELKVALQGLDGPSDDGSSETSGDNAGAN